VENRKEKGLTGPDGKEELKNVDAFK